MGTGRERVPIDERGGKRYLPGTVYYSKREGGFLAAGSEHEGVLPIGSVSGRLSYSIDKYGVARFRDETGVFVKTGVFIRSAGTHFRTGLLDIRDFPVTGDPRGQKPGPDAQFVERITVLMPDGKVKVIEVNHGIGTAYNENKQSKQWYRKMKEALGEEGDRLTTRQMQAFVNKHEVILRKNLGPIGQGG